jgi:hypothetical protein
MDNSFEPFKVGSTEERIGFRYESKLCVLCLMIEPCNSRSRFRIGIGLQMDNHDRRQIWSPLSRDLQPSEIETRVTVP